MKKRHQAFLLLSIASLILLGFTVLSAASPLSLQSPQNTSSAEELAIKNMTLEEKIGQLMIVGYPKGTSENTIKEYISKYKVGGFILFRRNYKDFTSEYQLTAHLNQLNKNNPLPLFLATDEEGGTVSRLPAGGTHFPDARLLGLANDPDITEKVGQTMGLELNAGGINMDFAPVLDIVPSETNKFLYRRSYGSTPSQVTQHGLALIRGLRSQNIIAVPKHFPGHGATVVDSHGKLPVIKITKKTLADRELVPYKAAISEGLDAVMAGHLAFPLIDKSGLPATKSKVFLTNILRDELGFQGIVITDEIEMIGFSGSSKNMGNAAVSAFNAGVDVFVIGHTKKIQDEVYKALLNACKSGEISKERLDQSVLRIAAVKHKYHLGDKPVMSLQEAKTQFGNKASKQFLDKLNRIIKKPSGR